MKQKTVVEPSLEGEEAPIAGSAKAPGSDLDDKTLRELNARLRKLKGTPENEADRS
jgi:hypothetical protein